MVPIMEVLTKTTMELTMEDGEGPPLDNSYEDNISYFHSSKSKDNKCNTYHK
jgi:hypothetical protein